MCDLQVLREDSVCLSVSDGSLLPVFSHMLGAKKVFALEPLGYQLYNVTIHLFHLSFYSLAFCLGLQFGKLQNVQTGY